MVDKHLAGQFVVRGPPPSPWAVAAFVGACAFAGGALLLLILSWR